MELIIDKLNLLSEFFEYLSKFFNNVIDLVKDILQAIEKRKVINI